MSRATSPACFAVPDVAFSNLGAGSSGSDDDFEEAAAAVGDRAWARHLARPRVVRLLRAPGPDWIPHASATPDAAMWGGGLTVPGAAASAPSPSRSPRPTRPVAYLRSALPAALLGANGATDLPPAPGPVGGAVTLVPSQMLVLRIVLALLGVSLARRGLDDVEVVSGGLAVGADGVAAGAPL